MLKIEKRVYGSFTEFIFAIRPIIMPSVEAAKPLMMVALGTTTITHERFEALEDAVETTAIRAAWATLAAAGIVALKESGA